MPTVSLPMYVLPELDAACDALWAGIARRLRAHGFADVPEHLARGRPVDALWRDPDLLLSQACGYNIVNGYVGHLRPVATPRYAASECRGANYCSVVVVRDDHPAATLDDLRGAVCAVNGPESHSGMNALRALVAPLARDGRFFGAVTETGAHVASLAAVLSGAADVAAIDCVCFALLARHRPQAVEGARVLCRTDSAPGLPFVTRVDADAATVEGLRAALVEALVDPDTAAARDALLLEGIEVLADDAYGAILDFERRAAALGYPALG